MTRDELEHAIRAACDIGKTDELIVIGSQSILGQFPDAPAALRQSVEVDVVVPVTNPSAADLIDGVLGERSRFHDTHGFYIHGLTLDAATLPAGWESRLILVRPDPLRAWVGNCLQGNDLAASKLAAFRDKDRDFVRVLLAERMLDGTDIVERLRLLPMDAPEIERRVKWVAYTLRDLQLPAIPL